MASPDKDPWDAIEDLEEELTKLRGQLGAATGRIDALEAEQRAAADRQAWGSMFEDS